MNKTIEEVKQEVKTLQVKMRLEDPKVTYTMACIQYAKDAGFKSWYDLTVDCAKRSKMSTASSN